MIGVAALTITLSVMGGFEQSLKERVLALSPQVEILNSQGSIDNYGDIEKKVATVPGVNGADAYIVGQGLLSSGRAIGGEVVRGVEHSNPVVRHQWGRYMIAGSIDDLSRSYTIPAGAAGPAVSTGGIAIGVSLAKKLKAKQGDPVRVVAPIISPDGSLSTKTAQFAIASIFDSGMNYIDTNMVFMDLTRAQDFFGRAGKVDGVDVHLANLDQTDAVTEAVGKLFPNPYRVRNWIEFNESAAAGFQLLKEVYSLVLLMLIGVAAFNLVATLIMVVMEKRKDIAVLIAMGATRREVGRIFVFKGLTVGAAGTLAGEMVGALGCYLLANYQIIRIPKEVYEMSTPPVAARPLDFALVALGSLALCLIATLYPARQAARAMPIE